MFVSQARWLTPVIPALWEAKVGRSPERKLRQENCLNPRNGDCSELRSCHCTPAWVTERLFKKKKKMAVIFPSGVFERERDYIYIIFFPCRCKPEYKVPGLYVIDSIVRQSRHQFGQEKDVFAPRFSNNIISTFQNLYRCPGDDKSKIVRVLNLWQKNNVFKSEIIQPLLDMAAGIPPPVVTPVLASTTTAMSNTPVTHTCNPSTLGGQGRQITWGQEFETSLANMNKKNKRKKEEEILEKERKGERKKQQREEKKE
ncbi:SR-related and CTD-associated factor 8 [Plecturocebus cupreus]